MNVKLLRRVKRHILAEPRRFQMEDVVYQAKPGTMYSDYGLNYKVPRCGTVACIAGWTNLLTKNSENWKMSNAECSLGLNVGESSVLFIQEHWPEIYRKKWRDAKTPRGRARVAANRIEYFIKNRRQSRRG